MAVVAAEIFGVPGLGQRMMQASNLLASDIVVIYMATMAALYGIIDTGFVASNRGCCDGSDDLARQGRTDVSRATASATEVLRDFSLDIQPGGFVAIVGPSGVGKSTLLRVVAGLLPPSAGSVAIKPTQRQVRCRSRWCFRMRGCCRGARSRAMSASGWSTARSSARERARQGVEAALGLVGLAATAAAIRTNCPAASVSASRWRARLRSIRTFC